MQIGMIGLGRMGSNMARRLEGWSRVRGVRRIAKSGRDMAAEIEAYRRELNVPRIGVPDDVASMAAFILSPRGRWLHGATIILDGGEIEML